MPATYFLGSRCLGTAPSLWWSDTQIDEFSRALFCPQCGEVWARIYQPGKPWSTCNTRCYKCGDGSLVPSWFQGFNTFPDAVLEHELSLLLERIPCIQSKTTPSSSDPESSGSTIGDST